MSVPFYVMPMFTRTLHALNAAGIRPDDVLPLFTQVLDGVEAAHKVNVFHRDLKPENILFDEATKRLVVADFGIASFREFDAATAVETTHAAKLANLRYSAPEQRQKGAEVTLTADIFALGLILNEMFTGNVPQGVGYTSIASVAPKFAYLDDIISRMIQQQPGARYASIDEIKKELIGRGNEFVARQRLDELRNTVVPASEPGAFEDISLVAVDWQNGQLIGTLNRTPEPAWTNRFRQPRGTWQSLQGSGPEVFRFMGNQARVGVEGHNAPMVKDHFKNYIEMANTAHRQDIAQAAIEQERQQRRIFEHQVREADERARVLANLKL